MKFVAFRERPNELTALVGGIASSDVTVDEIGEPGDVVTLMVFA